MLPTDTFLDALQESKLLSDDRLARARVAAADTEGPKSSVQIAEWLVGKGWVTRWQAKMLLANKRAFFLGKYKLLKMIGHGGMGSVFKAEQQPLGRIVAIKVMADRLVKSKKSVARFQREIQAVAALNHPNIVAAYDADCVGRAHFLVMEYVDGRTLEELIRKAGRLSIRDGCDYIRQASIGLQHACEQGMIHRDIKPSNLLLEKTARQGQDGPLVKILDMGLARVSSEADEEGLTQTGQVLGTPDYIAPEQAQNIRTADIRADIFSLGCTLFRLLTGGLPFGGATLMEKLMARGLHSARRIREVRADIPPALDAVVAKMLAKDPADRYQTPAQVAEALAPFCRWESASAESDVPAASFVDPASAAPGPQGPDTDSSLESFFNNLTAAAADTPQEQNEPGATSSSTLLRERRPKTGGGLWPRLAGGTELGGPAKWVSGAIAASVILVILGVILWTNLGATTLVIEWPEDERAGGSLEVDGHTVPLTAGPLRFTGWPGRQTLRATRKGYQPISQQWIAGRGELKTLPLKWKPTAETRRRQEFQALEERVSHLLANLKAGSAKPDDPSVEAAWNAALAFQRGQRATADALRIAAAASRLPVPADRLQRKDIPRAILAVAGGGKPSQTPEELVAIFGDNRLRHPGGTRCAALSPNAKWFATGGENSVVRLWSTADLRLARTLVGHGQTTVELQFSEDSQHLYGMSRQERLAVWNVNGSDDKPLRVFTPPGAARGLLCFRVSNDERQLAVGSDGPDVCLWNLSATSPPRILKHHSKYVHRVAFSRDGATLVSVGLSPGRQRGPATQTAAVWETADGKLRTVTPALGLGAAAVSPDARLLAVREGRNVQVWDLNKGERFQSLPVGGEPRGLEFSPDGRRLCVTCDFLALWDTETWKDDETFAEDVLQARFTPDSQGLLLLSQHRPRLLKVDGSGELFSTGPAVLSALLGPEGKTAYWSTDTGKIVAVDLASGREQRTYALPGVAEVMAVSPDGRHIAAACVGKGAYTLTVLDLEDGQTHDIGRGFKILDLCSHPAGGKWAAGTFEGDLKVFDSANAREEVSIRTRKTDRHEIFGVAWDPAARLIATGCWASDQSLRLWDVAEQSEQARLKGHQGHVHAVEFSADGQTLYSGSGDGTVRAWDAAQQTAKSTVVFHGHPILSLALSPDGKTLIAGAQDGGLVIATLPDGDPHRTLESNHSGAILAVALTPEARHALTVNQDGTAFLLRLQAWKP